MKRFLPLLGSVCFFSSCYYDNKEELYPAVTSCDSSAVTYTGKVLPIIVANCYACHGNGSTLGNVNLDGHANLKVVSDNGKLAGVIEHQGGFSPMPQGGNKLDPCDIQVIEKWISDGAPNN